METPPLRVRTLSHRCKGFWPRPPGLPPLNGDPLSKGAATRRQEQRLQGAETVTPGPEQDAPHPSVQGRGTRKSNSSRGLSGPLSRVFSTPAYGCTVHPPQPCPRQHGLCVGTSSEAAQTDSCLRGAMACRGLDSRPRESLRTGRGWGGLCRLSSEVVQTPASISALRRTNCVSLKRALSPLT